MIKQLDIIRKIRTSIIELISDMSIEELNTIPAGFNNNIVWNVAHLLAAQDNIFYVKAGHPLTNISQEYFDAYKPGSKPERSLSTEEFEEIKQLLFSSIDKLEGDIKRDILGNYTQWTTRYGFEMESIDDALTVLPFHDGLHFGYMMALKRRLRYDVGGKR